MKLFLASPHTLTRFKDGAEIMKLFLAGNTIFPQYIAPEVYATVLGRGRTLEGGGGYDPIIYEHRPYILESFYYADADTERLIPYYGDFLLDSGAFTFMQGKGGKVDFVEYAERYADFINRNNVKKFFELDIDSVVGYDKVKDIRCRLERLTNRQSIPVWHRSRGQKNLKDIAKNIHMSRWAVL